MPELRHLPKPGVPSSGTVGHSAFTHEPPLVRDYRGCERHRFGRTIDTLKAGMLEAARPRPVDPDHLPNGRRPATRPDDAIALPSFDLPACTHDDLLSYMRERAAKPDEVRDDNFIAAICRLSDIA
jgi:hypothetical protein